MGLSNGVKIMSKFTKYLKPTEVQKQIVEKNLKPWLLNQILLSTDPKEIPSWSWWMKVANKKVLGQLWKATEFLFCISSKTSGSLFVMQSAKCFFKYGLEFSNFIWFCFSKKKYQNLFSNTLKTIINKLRSSCNQHTYTLQR